MARPLVDISFVFFIPRETDLKSFTMGGVQQDLDSPTHVP